MMTMEIKGIDDIKNILDDVAPKRAENLLNATIRGVAVEGQKLIKGKLQQYNDTGNLIKSLKVKSVRSPKDYPSFKVEFDSGAGKKNDGFYWRFLEHGTEKDKRERLFVRKSKIELTSSLDLILLQQFAKKYESAMKRELKRQAKANAI